MNQLPAVADVIPHSPPMILLDRIVAYSHEGVTCAVEIHAGSPFIEHGNVPAVVGLEYMAQSVAVYAGMTARLEGRAKRIGLLLGCRDLRLTTDAFSVGQTLKVDAIRTFGESDLGSFNCKVTRAGELLLTGTLNVYQGPLPDGLRR
jgi:predicted hotdog family 3-hydroxylacyl-ACP dehydratase